jgi:hypothetical protein
MVKKNKKLRKTTSSKKTTRRTGSYPGKSYNHHVWAQFDMIDGEISVTNRGNYKDAEIDGMIVFIKTWLEN